VITGPTGKAAIRVWSAVCSVLIAVVFFGTTVLTVGLWFVDDDYTETTPVGDLSFFALGAIIALGLASQGNPGHGGAGVHQALIGTFALGAAGYLGDRIEPLVGSLLLLLMLAVLLLLHPARHGLYRRDGPVSIPLTGLAVFAAVPSLWYAAAMLSAAVDAGPSCFLGQCARGDRLAEMAAAVFSIPVVGLMAALKIGGWRLPLWSAGAGSILIGAASVWLADAPGSLGRPWGVFAVVWGLVFVTLGLREAIHRRPERPSGRPRNGDAARPAPVPGPDLLTQLPISRGKGPL
jgi:hypothetical protein